MFPEIAAALVAVYASRAATHGDAAAGAQQPQATEAAAQLAAGIGSRTQVCSRFSLRFSCAL